MSEHVYKVIEIVGTSPFSVDEAIRNAVSRASTSLHNVRWFETLQVRGEVEDGQIAHFQVTMKVGFTLD